MQKRYCDICGKEINFKEDYAVVGTEIKHNALFCQSRINTNKIYNVEMCKGCYEKFYEMYKEFVENMREIVEQEEQ